MKPITSFLAVISILTSFTCRAAEQPDVEGLYVSDANFTGEAIELKNKRFKFSTSSDVSSGTEDTGKYKVDGIRIFLIGDKPEFAEVRIWASYDGVAMLLMPYQYRALKKESKIPGFVLVRANPKELEQPDWWRKLKKEHPKFATAIGQKSDE